MSAHPTRPAPPGREEVFGAPQASQTNFSAFQAENRALRAELEALRAENTALRDRQALSDQIFEQADTGIWLIDAEGRTKLVNPRMASILGYTPPEMLGRSLFDFMDAEGQASAARNLERRRAGIEEEHTFRFQRKDGRPVWTTLITGPVSDAQGRYAGAVAFVTDLTEEHARERELALAQRLLAAAVEQSQAGVVIAEAPDGLIRMANAAALGVRGNTGLPLTDIPTALHPSNWRLFWPDGTPCEPRALPLIRAVQQGETSYGVELMIERDTGERRTILTNCAPVREANGAIVAGVVVFTDITEQKRVEAESAVLQRKLLEAQRVESLGVLAGGLAHDFNNLLAAILGHTELARMLLPADHPAAGKLAKVVHSAEVAAGLTRQVLSFAGRTPVDIQPVALGSLVSGLQALLSVARAPRVQVELRVPEDLPPVLADATQVQQLLMNLVLNGIDAVGNAGGHVSVCASATAIDAAVAGGLLPAGAARVGPAVCVEVTDDGCGMDEDTMQRIFDPYFTRKGKGHGLGLAAALGIVRAHEGGIEVQSAPGRGTVFRVYLPASAAAVAGASPAEEAPRGRARVLMVDDDALVRDALRSALETFGHRVTEASGGREALEILHARPTDFDLIVLDVGMPDLPGDEVFATLCAEGFKVPVLLCSGYAEAHAVQRLKGMVPAGFLQKPVRPSTLARRVGEILRA